MEPIKFKNETPEITAMRDELSELLKQYEKGEISYNVCVGMGMKPPCFLKKGDVVVCEIEKIGKIENEVV